MIIEAKNLSKAFIDGNRKKEIVHDFNYVFPSRGLVCFIGQSGSGKTTFINILSSLLKPDTGSVILNGQDIYSLSEKERSKVRDQHIGYVFQEENLIENITVFQNLCLVNKDESDIDYWLKAFGVFSLKNTLASKLSGGEKQRVAIARCMLKQCAVIFFDEPTASLDRKNSKDVIEAINEVSKKSLCVVSTHDLDLVERYADIIVKLDGEGHQEIIQKKEISNSGSNDEELAINHRNKKNNRVDYLFGWKSIWKRKSKAVALMALSTIAMLLTIGHGSISLFDSASAFNVALKKEEAWCVPLQKNDYNKPTMEEVTVKAGMSFFEESKKQFDSAFPLILARENLTNTDLYVAPYIEGLSIKGHNVKEPNEGYCVVSSFLKDLSKEKLNISLATYGGNTLTFDYADVIKVEYSPSVMNSHRFNPNYQRENQDDFIKDYAFVIINENDFKTLYNSSSALFLPASQFIATSLSMKEYSSLESSCAAYSSQSIIKGAAPSKRDEVVISKQYLKSIGINDENIDELLGKEFAYRDLNSSPNYVMYQSKPNIYDVQKKVTVVGISDVSDVNVLVHVDLYKDICELLPYYSYQVCALTTNYKKISNKLANNDIVSTYHFLEPIYALEKLRSGPISGILIALGVILYSLIAIVGFSLGSESIIGKEKHIALMMSLGHSSRELSTRYIIGSAIFQTIAFIGSSLLALVSINIIDAVLMSEKLLAISYPLLRLEIPALAICFGVAILSSIFTSFSAMRRLAKIDIADTFRGKV